MIEAALGAAPGALHEGQYVCVGDVIDTDEQEGFLRGHGTHVVDGRLIATLCGVVERVNKLVFVRPLKTRYDAAQGDVVVGRVTELAGKRWKVDLASRHEASLLLSAVNLPGGIQRRRNAEDELRMREVFREGDLLSAEVQSVQTDGSVALHTRSLKYGLLVGGQLVQVPPALVKRQKQHFHTLEAIGVDLILGCNGLLWVQPHASPPPQSSIQGGTDGDADSKKPTENAPTKPPCSRHQLEVVARVGNAIRALAHSYLAIYPTTIMETYELALGSGTPLKEMLESAFLMQVVRNEAIRRHNLLEDVGGKS
eukprot:CAMPEP_0202388924 /NCGR_PEP_ID=MMETSP1127-20130417/80199_1 /ASSEMBLY_ACC=CAM_ASM_000462 /TAXON_ID=3047 /ORGANISM="Dunaliella tertiolecta, Strain CCMP1320" /LENGTH=310 /DNA_ID=CAMNT_0048990517 /DNA_START=228 /DNA_END=1160 /DNA_ORIENTATION=-